MCQNEYLWSKRLRTLPVLISEIVYIEEDSEKITQYLISLRYSDLEVWIYNRVISDIFTVLRETTVTTSESLDTFNGRI